MRSHCVITQSTIHEKVNDIILIVVYHLLMKTSRGRYYHSKLFTMNKIDYYTCWEDFKVIQKALQVDRGDVIFSITSGGCNILNFLVYDPKKIVAVDYNPYQNYLLELKMEALRILDYQQFLQFMGVKPSSKREQLYETIRQNLSNKARALWDRNSYAIQKGVLLVGEQNVKNVGKFLRFFKGRSTIENFFLTCDIKEQTEYFNHNIYGFPWRLYQWFTSQDQVVKLILCLRAVRELPYRRKRSTGYLEYLRHVHYPPEHTKIVEEVFSFLPVQQNHFASLMLLGYYHNKECFPPYLMEQNYNKVRQRLERIEMMSAPVAEVLPMFPREYFTKFNLSNIFDWVEHTAFHQQLRELIKYGSEGGKILYTTTRSDRGIPTEITALSQEAQLASELIHEDRTTLYSKYQLGTIRK